jgi:SH3-like domain-containing protein
MMRNVLYGLLLFLALGSASNATPGDVLYVQASTVNVRQFPSLEAEVLTRLNRGSKVVEVRREGDWIRVRNDPPNGAEGYVHGSLLRSAPPSDDRARQQPTDEQILNLTWDVSKKLEQVLREIEQLKDNVSHLKNRLIRLEGKVDRLRHETRRQLR